MVEHIRWLLYWPHTSTYDGGTSGGNGLVGTLFLQLEFVSSAGILDVGHGPVKTLFLSLILCLSPMTPCETVLYWPHTRALLAYNAVTSVGHGAIKTLFLEPDVVPSASALDVGHGCQDSFLGLDFVSLVHDTLSNYVVLAPYQCLGGL